MSSLIYSISVSRQLPSDLPTRRTLCVLTPTGTVWAATTSSTITNRMINTCIGRYVALHPGVLNHGWPGVCVWGWGKRKKNKVSLLSSSGGLLGPGPDPEYQPGAMEGPSRSAPHLPVQWSLQEERGEEHAAWRCVLLDLHPLPGNTSTSKERFISFFIVSFILQ